VTLDEIDRALADWKARRQRIDDNLMALETDPACMLLEQASAAGTTVGLDGITRDRVVPALAAMRELFAQRTLLDGVIEKATSLRAGINRLWPGDGPKEIDRLLHGASIALPPVETPLARRGLLDAAETTTAISPDQLLAAMTAAFDAARDAVASVSQAWDRLTPAITATEADAAKLADLAADLGDDATAELASVRAEIDAVRTRVARDPLGASDALTRDVAARITALSARLESLATTRATVEADRQRAARLLADIRSTHAAAVDAAARASAEITGGPRAEPVAEDRIAGLAEWFATLDATVTARRWEAASVGLDRWTAAATPLLAEDTAARDAALGGLAHRDELVGRLAARRQQAKTLAARGHALPASIDSLAEQAAAALAARPCAIDECDRLVAQFERALRG